MSLPRSRASVLAKLARYGSRVLGVLGAQLPAGLLPRS